MVEKGYIEDLWEVIMSVGYTSFCFIIITMYKTAHVYVLFGINFYFAMTVRENTIRENLLKFSGKLHDKSHKR